jgi:hypothetical protein
MDDFLAELEASFTNLGSNKHWKRQIGDVTLWFSPITMHGQTKVTELLNSADTMGMNVINETKRVTLSYSIVGINDLDLREYRDTTPRFPLPGKDGKMTKVTLDRYLYHKMLNWSSQFVDDAFSVLTDLIETDQKENLKNIKFENAKNAETELAELEARASFLRQELGKPQLVEAKPEPEKTDEDLEIDETLATTEATSTKPVVEVEFDPFSKVDSTFRNKPVVKSVEAPVPASPPPVATPVVTAPPAISDPEELVFERQVKDKHGNVINAYVPTPGVSNEVIEAPTSPVRSGNPVVDPPVVNRNPRFSPPSR